jgi:hypothetical protein
MVIIYVFLNQPRRKKKAAKAKKAKKRKVIDQENNIWNLAHR